MVPRVANSLESLFCFFAISFFMGAYVTIPSTLRGIESEGGLDDPVNIICQVVILLGLGVFYTRRWRLITPVALQGRIVLLFITLATASLSWSTAPETTLRQAYRLILAVLFAWYASASFSAERFIRMLATCSIVSGAASLILAVAWPQVGVMTGHELAGDWKGVYGHKNELGRMMVIGTLCYGWLWVHAQRRRKLYALSVGLCSFMALMSASRTSQTIIVLLPLIGCCVGIARLSGLVRVWAVVLLSIGIIVGTLIGKQFYDYAMDLLNKDPTLTGRTELWDLLVASYWQRPILGYGYSAYFARGSLTMQWILELIDWPAAEAHQGYLDLALQLGIVGLVLGVWLLIETMRLALSRPMRDELSWASFAAVYSISLSMTNLVESMLLSRGSSIDTMITVSLYLGLRTYQNQRRRAAREARKPSHAS